MKASAAEAYKLETDGILLGWSYPGGVYVLSTWVIARADVRNYWKIETHTSRAIAEPFLEDWLVGGWHSHPDATVHMSIEDKRDSWDVEVVCSVERGPKKWRFKFGAYWEPEPTKWRRAKLVMPGD